MSHKNILVGLGICAWLVWFIGSFSPLVLHALGYKVEQHSNAIDLLLGAWMVWLFGGVFLCAHITFKLSERIKALEAEDLSDELNTPPPNFRELERDKMKTKLDVALRTGQVAEESEEDENLVNIDEEPTIEFVEEEGEFEHLKIFRCSMSQGYDLLEKEYNEWSKAQGEDIKISGRKVQTITNGFLLLVFYHKVEY